MKILRAIMLSAVFGVFASCPAFAVGTASGTVLTANLSMPVYNFATSTPSSSAALTVKAVYGFATAAYAEGANASTNAGGTATYAFTLVNGGNATAPVTVSAGPQSFSGPVGTQAEWGVAADGGAGFLTFTTSASQTAAQGSTDTAAVTSLSPDATVTVTLHNRTSPSAVDGGSSSFGVAFNMTGGPGGAYLGYNNTRYAGPTAWGRQLNAGFVITTINGVVLNATKTLAVSAPASYVASGGSVTDPTPGATVTFTMQFSNNGSVAASGVAILDDLPSSTTFVYGSIMSCFTGTGCVPAADADVDGANPDCYYIPGSPPKARCDVDTLGAGAGGKLQYSVTID